MKKFITIILAVIIGAATLNAQSFLERLGRSAVERAKWRVEDKVHQKVDQKVDEAMDGALNRKDKKDRTEKDEQREDSSVEKRQKRSESESRDYGYTEDTADSQPAEEAQQTPKTAKNLEIAYSKCDFVAGDEIIFEDTMDGEQLGEFPSQWDLIEGVAEVTMIGEKKAISFTEGSTKICPLMNDPKAYLPEVFTIEYDFYIPAEATTDNQESPEYCIEMYDADEGFVFGTSFNDMSIMGEGAYTAHKPARTPDGNMDRIDGTYKFGQAVQTGTWNHFALSFNKRACKAYINGSRVINIPNMAAPRFIIVNGPYHLNNYHLITNFRIAQGAVPLYDRMMSDGKFITYGITFDVGKSVIKPESMGEISRIVKLMSENPELKFSVEGHTDSTGNAASNQKLSEQRSQAIVDKLVELGIARDRLSASGKGQNSPVADNSTDEGRAKNRRVEFVRQ